jgi:hypothetical protein
MNKSKITAYTALATVMSASAAYADLSLSGLMAGTVVLVMLLQVLLMVFLHLLYMYLTQVL